jgi:hypothetical protein
MNSVIIQCHYTKFNYEDFPCGIIKSVILQNVSMMYVERSVITQCHHA